jgi:hypothetical protein
MASNFAFYPQGGTVHLISDATTRTLTLTLAQSGGTGTMSLTGGNYGVSGVRIANTGTTHAFIMFTPATGGAVLNTTNGFPVLSNTIETFRTQGLPVLQTLAATGSTTLWITSGEGL